MQEKGNRILYLDVLRILSACMIVMIHVVSQYWDIVDTHSFEWKVFNFFDSIARWGTPVFVMISGSLFLSHEIPLRKLYTKYIFRIAAAFIFWSFSYAFVLNFWGKWDVKNFLAWGIKGQTHLWFLFMIVGLYMAVPFLYTIVQNKVLTKYFIILSLIFTFVLPQTVSVLSVFSPKYGNFINSVIGKMRFHFVLGFTSYFILGYYLSSTEITVKYRKTIYFLGLAGFFSTIVCSQFISNYSNAASTVFYNSLTVNVLLEAVSVFTFFKNLLNHKNVNKRIEKIVRALSKYSFGVYFIHVAVIVLLDKTIKLNTLSYLPIFSVPLNTAIVCVISFSASAVVNQIPILKKYIV